MLAWRLEAFAPSRFTKGINKYDNGDFHSASRLLKRAGKWMPELYEDGLFNAYVFLINYHLSGDAEGINVVIENLGKSSFKGYNS